MTAPGWGDDPSRSHGTGPAGGEPELQAPPPGPPGSGVFSLEGRRAPGLYLVAWLLAVGGILLTLLIGPMANSQLARFVLVGLGLSMVTVGLAAGAGSQIVDRRDRDPERYRGPSPLLLFGIRVTSVWLVATLLLAVGIDVTEDPAVFLVSGIVLALVYVGVVWLFAVRSGALTWAQMGWPTWRGAEPSDVVGSVLSSAVLMVPITLGVIILGGVIATLLGTEAPDVVPAASTSVEWLAVVISAAVLIPIGEEVFFRGLAVTAWQRDLGARAALARSTVFFALVHTLNIATADFGAGAAQAILMVAVILPVGLALGWMYLRRGLIGSITGHATYNLILLLLMFAGGNLA